MTTHENQRFPLPSFVYLWNWKKNWGCKTHQLDAVPDWKVFFAIVEMLKGPHRGLRPQISAGPSPQTISGNKLLWNTDCGSANGQKRPNQWTAGLSLVHFRSIYSYQPIPILPFPLSNPLLTPSYVLTQGKRLFCSKAGIRGFLIVWQCITAVR